MRSEVLITQEEANRLLEYWQRQLRLQDWWIQVKIARGNGLNLPAGVQGRCSWTLQRREAFIRILDPIDWDRDCVYPQDMEETLVHELLHLHFAPFDTFKAEGHKDIASEQAINAIAHSLVSLKRERGEKDA